MKQNIKRIIAIVVISIAIVCAAPVLKASASSYYVANHTLSVTSINVYNHAGCDGVTRHVYPGDAAFGHLWKTFWLPAHKHAVITHDSLGIVYTVTNREDYHKCVKIGKYFDPIGISIRVRNN